MDAKKIYKIIERIARGDIKDIYQVDLEETLHFVGLGNLAGNRTIINAIRSELDKRHRAKEISISEKAVFWQKWGVVFSIILSLLALGVSIIAYLKTP